MPLRICNEQEEEQELPQKEEKLEDYSIEDIKKLLPDKTDPCKILEYIPSSSNETPELKIESTRLRTHSIDWNECLIELIGWISCIVNNL